MMMHKSSLIGKGSRMEYERLLQQHGGEGLIPVHEEAGVYIFHLEVEQTNISVAPIEEVTSKEGTAGPAHLFGGQAMP